MENKVLVVVNGRQITEGDLNQTIAKFPKERQGYFQNPQRRTQLLEQLVSLELVYNFAIDNDYEKDEVYIAQMEAAKKEILTQTAVNKILSELIVTESEAEEFYNSNKEKFVVEQSVRAKHILVDAEEQAAEIRKKISEGMTFEDAAQEFSDCPSKEQGGDLGSFTKGKMVVEFEKTAFELPLGVVSEPVKTQFGYHLIKVEEKTESVQESFEKVKGMIIENLTQQKQTEKYVELIEELKGKYKVEVI